MAQYRISPRQSSAKCGSDQTLLVGNEDVEGAIDSVGVCLRSRKYDFLGGGVDTDMFCGTPRVSAGLVLLCMCERLR